MPVCLFGMGMNCVGSSSGNSNWPNQQGQGFNTRPSTKAAKRKIAFDCAINNLFLHFLNYACGRHVILHQQ